MLQKLKRIDGSIIAIVLLLMFFSTLLVYSATLDDPNIHLGIGKNALNCGLGFVAFLVFMFIDYRFYAKIYWYMYGVGLLMLGLVFKYGVVIHSARSWFRLPGGLDFQPAELVKLILIITLAMFMARKNGEKLGLIRDVIPIGLLAFVPFALVMIQPDLGNAVIYLVVLTAMLWIGNIKYTHAIIGLTAIVAGVFLFFTLFANYHDPIKDFLTAKHKEHWVERIDTFLDPENADKDAIYQVEHSMTAIGSGGLFGEGYLHGNSIHSSFIPYAYSDSIFVVVGEEFGFVGASVLLLFYFLLIYRLILIAIQSQTPGGSFIIAGIVSMFVFQIFENIGMFVGIMPLTGITLPFISYGGTSLMINMMSLGIAMSIRMHRDEEAKY